ncbi:uncharacterized protein TNCV_2132091 [Trichonephila clavipes]|nr:uncharacterized protein TNCV_2132091 [Trichonephila clavipes]
MRAIGDRPCYFQPQSSNEDDNEAGTLLFELPNHTNGRTLSLDTLNVHLGPSTRQNFSGIRTRTHDTLLMTTRGLLEIDHVILNHGQVMWTTPELEPSLLTTRPDQWEDVSALDRFNVHLSLHGRSLLVLELVTRPATIRYLDHSSTTAT